MNIVDYFDEYNHDHILAWKYLSEKGHWSHRFQAQLDNDGVDEWQIAWQVVLAAKMAQAWVQFVIDRNEMR